LENGQKYLSKNHFSREKSCKKIHDFHFCPFMQSFPIFSSKITTATFFWGILAWFTFQQFRKNVIRLPEKREKRHPVTRKTGKTSSGYPKNGKNVIQLPEKREKRHSIRPIL
jgi:hypothetical protein